MVEHISGTWGLDQPFFVKRLMHRSSAKNGLIVAGISLKTSRRTSMHGALSLFDTKKGDVAPRGHPYRCRRRMR
ncbi:hypothetical protein [Zymomonas mobilis]|uniref:hypothetical protein n=1 Tax=Zymomonas mobilis TaxID=542 RepID=UPI0039EBEDE0